MKKMFLFLCLSPLVIGCATTLSNTESEIDALRRENAELKRQAIERDGLRPAAPAVPKVVQTPAVVPAPAVVPVARPEDMVPPPARPQFGPPQNWGWLYVTPRGCHRPFLFPIENKTNYFLKIRLDGQEIRIRGANSALPLLPPGQTVYVCLSSTGQHQLMGDAYASRFGQLKRVEAFNTPIHSGSSLTVDDAVLFLW